MTKYLVLQATGLLSLIAILSFKHAELHQGAHVAHEPTSALEWQQPIELNARYVTPIGNRIWRVQFTAVEPILRRISTNANGQLIVNQGTPLVLEQACSELGASVDEANWQRLQILLEKGWLRTGRELHSLWQKYCAYETQYKDELIRVNQAAKSEKRRLLEHHVKLNQERQIRFFGEEYARLMFADINAQTRYLSNRRLLMLNDELSQQEKLKQLKKLERDYKSRVKSESR